MSYNHEKTTKDEHEEEVGGLAAKRALFQKAAITICEQNVEKKIEAYRAKIAEISKQAPYLESNNKKKYLYKIDSFEYYCHYYYYYLKIFEY